MFHFTYQTKNLINNKTYIGVHSTNDVYDGYMGSGVILKKAFKKYGKINFKSQILDYFDTKEEAYEEESFLVCKEWVESDNNYNLILGGICNGRVGISPWNKGKTDIYSKEYLLEMSNRMLGNIAHNRKKVIDTNTGKTYKSITELSNSGDSKYKVSYLAEMLRGTKPNKTSYLLMLK
jgi:hypothetical protein